MMRATFSRTRLRFSLTFRALAGERNSSRLGSKKMPEVRSTTQREAARRSTSCSEAIYMCSITSTPPSMQSFRPWPPIQWAAVGMPRRAPSLTAAEISSRLRKLGTKVLAGSGTPGVMKSFSRSAPFFRFSRQVWRISPAPQWGIPMWPAPWLPFMPMPAARRRGPSTFLSSISFFRVTSI